MKKYYVPVIYKFYMSHFFAVLWVLFSILLSQKWILDLAELVTLPIALFIIIGIAFIPGYFSSFLFMSLLLDRQKEPQETNITDDITVLIAAYNEERNIGTTIRYLAKQNYQGKIHIIVVDNNSTENTKGITRINSVLSSMSIKVITEKKHGKNHALNTGLKEIKTKYFITLDSDTILHKSAIQNIVARIKSSSDDVCSVAGAIMVRNSRDNWLARIQEWDYFISIASVKRLQGLYQGTLVAQGAFSIYKTDRVRELGGWEDCIGEDIVLTWRFLQNGWKVYFEPQSIAFTDVPTSLNHFIKQRSRWARGMIEALKRVKPWQQPSAYAKYTTGINLAIPYIDFIFTFCWIPGLILAIFGHFWIVGPTTLLVLPITILCYYVLYRQQRKTFMKLGLRVRENFGGLFTFVLFYQMIMSPVSMLGYFQEWLSLKRVWK